MWYLAFPLSALLIAGPAFGAGGKNRLSEIRTDIEELYQLCEQAGTQTIVIEEDGVTVTLRCPGEPAPEPAEIEATDLVTPKCPRGCVSAPPPLIISPPIGR